MQLKQALSLLFILSNRSPNVSCSEVPASNTSHSDIALGEYPSSPTSECNPQVHIFMNPGSGGRKGAAILKKGISGIEFAVGGANVGVHVWDLSESESGQKRGFRQIENYIANSKCVDERSPVRVIAAGGDGTIMWVVSEALEHGINLNLIVIGTMPLGTANDFSNTYGWGVASSRHLFKHGLEGFKRLVRQWMLAGFALHDVWDVTVRVDATQGRLLQRKGKRMMRYRPDGNGVVLKKKMGNYFSFGAESQVGFEFDGYRTKSRILNKAVYVWQGIKGEFKKQVALIDILDKCMDGDKVLFSTRSEVSRLIGNPKSIIILNINSFAAGSDLWSMSDKAGVGCMNNLDPFQSQDAGDHKVEVVSYESLAGLASDRVSNTFVSGNGRRIGQAAGPLQFIFRKQTKTTKLHLQVDGEFYAAEEPSSIEVSHNSTIRVLVKNRRAGSETISY